MSQLYAVQSAFAELQAPSISLHDNRAPGLMEIVFPNYATQERQAHNAFPMFSRRPRKQLIVRRLRAAKSGEPLALLLIGAAI